MESEWILCRHYTQAAVESFSVSFFYVVFKIIRLKFDRFSKPTFSSCYWMSTADIIFWYLSDTFQQLIRTVLQTNLNQLLELWNSVSNRLFLTHSLTYFLFFFSKIRDCDYYWYGLGNAVSVLTHGCCEWCDASSFVNYCNNSILSKNNH